MCRRPGHVRSSENNWPLEMMRLRQNPCENERRADRQIPDQPGARGDWFRAKRSAGKRERCSRLSERSDERSPLLDGPNLVEKTRSEKAGFHLSKELARDRTGCF